MFKKSKVSSGVLVALGGALLAGAVPSWAQTTERVEVTGSRIKSIGATSSSPITSVGKADIDTTQPVAVEELVRGLAAAYPAIGPGVNNGSNGTASIDLRGLGTNRTLVLINDRRVVPATLGGVVDTNIIPVSLLERVDIVTGGASAVYGADAVSGVVNFKTKRNFSGVEATTLYSETGQGDAKRRKSDLTIGANLADGRGNVAVHVGTTKTDALKLGQRDYASTVISSTTGAPGGFSGTAVPAQWSGMPAPINGSQVIDASTGLLRAVSGTADAYNTNPPNYFETPLTRTQVTGIGRFTINEHAEAYTEIFHTRSNVTLNLAPSGTFGVALNIPIGNPYIPSAVRQQLCTAYGIAAANCVVGNTTEFKANIARRFVEAGPRVYSYDNTTTQYTAGLRGSIPYLESWSYDAYYQSGRSEQIRSTANGFGATKLQQAVRSLTTTNCTVTTGGCVPINLFGAAGSISQAMLDFISVPTFQTTLVTQQITSASASGDVGFLKSPLARNPLSMAIGFEQRAVFGGNKSDAVIQTQGELLGSGAPTPDRSGELKFKEYYAELNMPLVANLPFAQAINLEGGYRETHFSTSAGADKTYGSWKAGGDWVPVKGLRLRAEQQRATRAPNVNELFAPQVTGLATLSTDPCQGTRIRSADAGVAGTLTNLCQQTGVPSSQIGAVAAPSSSQINNTTAGNPNLGPEKADTTTMGIVWEPEFARDLSVSVDYWKIKVKEAIATPSANQVVNGCFSTSLNPTLENNTFCQLIQRDALNGGLNGVGSRGVTTLTENKGVYNYDGVDIGANYRLPLSRMDMPAAGRVDLGMTISLLGKADFKAAPLVPNLEQAGHYGVDVTVPYPKTKFTQRGTWTMGDYSVGYNWRYIGATKVLPGATFQAAYSSIPVVNYFDLNASAQVTKNLRLSMTINNITDKSPPFVGTGIGDGTYNYGNTYPTVYDVIGRRFTVSATATF